LLSTSPVFSELLQDVVISIDACAIILLFSILRNKLKDL
jgi:hypothetical protein